MRYVSRDEDVNVVADLSFDARSYGDIHARKLPAPPTRVKLSIRDRRSLRQRLWPLTVALGDVSVPTAPWFDKRLLAFVGDRLVVGVANGLLWIDPATARVMKSIVTGNTPVMEILVDYDRRHILVVNEGYGFVDDQGGSNLAAVDLEGSLVWRASIAVEHQGYSQIDAVHGAVIEMQTWRGRCLLDADNGHVTDCWETKGS